MEEGHPEIDLENLKALFKARFQGMFPSFQEIPHGTSFAIDENILSFFIEKKTHKKFPTMVAFKDWLLKNAPGFFAHMFDTQEKIPCFHRNNLADKIASLPSKEQALIDDLIVYASSRSNDGPTQLSFLISPNPKLPAPDLCENSFLRSVLWHFANRNIPVGKIYRHLVNLLRKVGVNLPNTKAYIAKIKEYYKTLDTKIYVHVNPATYATVATTAGGPFSHRQEDEYLMDTLPEGFFDLTSTERENVFAVAFDNIHEDVRREHIKSGSTAAVCVAKGDEFTISTLGDTAVYVEIRNAEGDVAEFKRLNDFHNGHNEAEIARAGAANFDKGRLRTPGQTRGGVSCSRAIGDIPYEENHMSHVPETRHFKLGVDTPVVPAGGSASLWIMTDGMFDHKGRSKDEAYIQYRLQTLPKEDNLPFEKLITEVIADGSTDNCTCIRLPLNPQSTQTNLVAGFDGRGSHSQSNDGQLVSKKLKGKFTNSLRRAAFDERFPELKNSIIYKIMCSPDKYDLSNLDFSKNILFRVCLWHLRKENVPTKNIVPIIENLMKRVGIVLPEDISPIIFKRSLRNHYEKLNTELTVQENPELGVSSALHMGGEYHRYYEQQDAVSEKKIDEADAEFYELLTPEEKKEVWVNAYDALQKTIVDAKKITRGGTTAAVCTAVPVANGTQLTTTSIGDCYVFLLTRVGGTQTIRQLNQLHNTANPDEVKRLQRENGLITVDGKRLCLPNPNNENKRDPADINYSLAVTSALGDVVADGFGVGHKPYVAHHFIPTAKEGEENIVCVMTDGVPEGLSAAEINRISGKCEKAKIAQSLVEQAIQRSTDNCGVVTLDIEANPQVARMITGADGHDTQGAVVSQTVVDNSMLEFNKSLEVKAIQKVEHRKTWCKWYLSEIEDETTLKGKKIKGELLEKYTGVQSLLRNLCEENNSAVTRMVAFHKVLTDGKSEKKSLGDKIAKSRSGVRFLKAIGMGLLFIACPPVGFLALGIYKYNRGSWNVVKTRGSVFVENAEEGDEQSTPKFVKAAAAARAA